jgi:hypothetical protein
VLKDEMHSYVEKVPATEVVDRAEQARRPMRAIISASFLIALALAAVIVIASDDGNDRTVLKPKFVDWKKEDAGSDDMNLHLRVADALAKADGTCILNINMNFLLLNRVLTGLSEKAPIPVPEQLLKEAQQAAEEQKSMPGVEDERMRKLHLPASLEKMFQQAKDEQEVEKLTKEGDQKVLKASDLLMKYAD